MKKRNLSRFRAILWLLLIMTAGMHASEWEKFEVDILQENRPERIGNADHLLPSEHIFPRDYYLIQFVELENYSRCEWMLRIELNRDKTGAVIRLYENIPDLQYDMRHYLQMEDYVSTSVHISLEQAEAVYGVWVNTLFETRYSKSDIGNFQGKIAQFSTYIRGTGWMVGEAQTGYGSDTPPNRLIQIAYLLKKYTNDTGLQGKRLAEVMQPHIDWIYGYLEKYGRH